MFKGLKRIFQDDDWSDEIGIIYGVIVTILTIRGDYQSATAVVGVGAALKGLLSKGAK